MAGNANVMEMAGKTEEMMKTGSVKELRRLEEENQRLKQDNEMLMKIVVQLKNTLSRVLNRYVV